MEVMACGPNEAESFAKALFADLIELHPAFYDLRGLTSDENKPDEVRRYAYDSVVGKGVMKIWHDVRRELVPKLQSNYPTMCKTEDNFKNCLEFHAETVLANTKDVRDQVLQLSAVLLEIISFLYRRGMTRFIHSASRYWLLMFQHVNIAEFQKHGGWDSLKLVAEKQAEIYDTSSSEILESYYGKRFSSSGVIKSSTENSDLSKENYSVKSSSADFTEKSSNSTNADASESAKHPGEDFQNNLQPQEAFPKKSESLPVIVQKSSTEILSSNHSLCDVSESLAKSNIVGKPKVDDDDESNVPDNFQTGMIQASSETVEIRKEKSTPDSSEDTIFSFEDKRHAVCGTDWDSGENATWRPPKPKTCHTPKFIEECRKFIERSDSDLSEQGDTKLKQLGTNDENNFTDQKLASHLKISEALQIADKDSPRILNLISRFEKCKILDEPVKVTKSQTSPESLKILSKEPYVENLPLQTASSSHANEECGKNANINAKLEESGESSLPETPQDGMDQACLQSPESSEKISTVSTLPHASHLDDENQTVVNIYKGFEKNGAKDPLNESGFPIQSEIDVRNEFSSKTSAVTDATDKTDHGLCELSQKPVITLAPSETENIYEEVFATDQSIGDASEVFDEDTEKSCSEILGNSHMNEEIVLKLKEKIVKEKCDKQELLYEVVNEKYVIEITEVSDDHHQKSTCMSQTCEEIVIKLENDSIQKKSDDEETEEIRILNRQIENESNEEQPNDKEVSEEARHVTEEVPELIDGNCDHTEGTEKQSVTNRNQQEISKEISEKCEIEDFIEGKSGPNNASEVSHSHIASVPDPGESSNSETEKNRSKEITEIITKEIPDFSKLSVAETSQSCVESKSDLKSARKMDASKDTQESFKAGSQTASKEKNRKSSSFGRKSIEIAGKRPLDKTPKREVKPSTPVPKDKFPPVKTPNREKTSTPAQKVKAPLGKPPKLPCSTAQKVKTPESKPVSPKIIIRSPSYRLLPITSDSEEDNASPALVLSKTPTGQSASSKLQSSKLESTRRPPQKASHEIHKPLGRTLSAKNTRLNTRDTPSGKEKSQEKLSQPSKVQNPKVSAKEGARRIKSNSALKESCSKGDVKITVGTEEETDEKTPIPVLKDEIPLFKTPERVETSNPDLEGEIPSVETPEREKTPTPVQNDQTPTAETMKLLYSTPQKTPESKSVICEEVISDSTEAEASMAVAPSKTPTSKSDSSKLESKSADRYERRRRSPIKEPHEMHKPLGRTVSVRNKSNTRDISSKTENRQKKHLQPHKAQISEQTSVKEGATGAASTSDSALKQNFTKGYSKNSVDQKQEFLPNSKSVKSSSSKLPAESSSKVTAASSRARNLAVINPKKTSKDSNNEKPRWR